MLCEPVLNENPIHFLPGLKTVINLPIQIIGLSPNSDRRDLDYIGASLYIQQVIYNCGEYVDKTK